MRQRAFPGAANANRLLYRVTRAELQGLRYAGRGGHGFHFEHADLGLQAHADQVLQQSCESRTLPFFSTWRRAGGADIERARAASRLPGDHALGRELLQSPTHGDARHRKLLHQRQFTR